jgi:hypothetical protein
MDFYEPKSSEPEMRYIDVRIEGTGASAPTKIYGKGVTVARSSAGIYTLTFSSSPGTWAGCTIGIEADTPADIKGHTVVATKTSSTVITLNFTGATETLHDLADNEFINLTLKYKQSNA